MNQGLNLTDNGNLPVEEAREQLGEVSFLLPYSKDIKAALSCGNLYAKNAGDRVWTGRMREIAAQVDALAAGANPDAIKRLTAALAQRKVIAKQEKAGK